MKNKIILSKINTDCWNEMEVTHINALRRL